MFSTHHVSRSSAGAGLSLLTGKGFGYDVLSYQNISDNESLGALRSSIISKILYCIAAGKDALMTLIMLRNWQCKDYFTVKSSLKKVGHIEVAHIQIIWPLSSLILNYVVCFGAVGFSTFSFDNLRDFFRHCNEFCYSKYTAVDKSKLFDKLSEMHTQNDSYPL